MAFKRVTDCFGKKYFAINKGNIFRRLSTGFLAINNNEIYYEHAGNSPDAILCIPGAFGPCRTHFDKQLDYLSKTFSVVTFDPRGYGKSLKKPRTFPSNFYHLDADDGAKIMEKLNFKRYSVFGWSDGGISALILAAKYQKAVCKLVVWGCNSFVYQEDINILEKTRDLSKWSERMKTPIEEIYGKEGLQTLWIKWRDAFFGFVDNDNGNICREELEKIQCPTLIVHGEKDPYVPSFHPEFIHERVKNSELVRFPEGKHNLHLRFYEDFNEMVTKFLQENTIA